MTSLSAQAFREADFPTGHVDDASAGVCRCAAQRDVGEERVSYSEMNQHIADCGWHMECAYARFQAHGDPHDRDAALQWLHLQNEALAARHRLAGAQRHAEFEERISAGLDYFQSEHALALGRQVGRSA